MSKISINIFFGPNNEFNKKIRQYNYYLDISTILSVSSISMLNEMKDSEQLFKISIKNPDLESIIVHGSDYALLSEAGEKGFAKYLKDTLDASSQYSNIKKVFLQNPTKNIINLISRVFNDKSKYDINEEYYEYPNVEDIHIKKLYESFSNEIIGQEAVKRELLKSLYYIKSKSNEKPVILMFYGASGVGKTETAKYLGSLFNKEILRVQMSMFQNYASKDYLFGTNHNADSLTKDLLERDTNIILLDEFDKVSYDVISAFYQFFDEGIYEDRNYKVNLKNSIIICTSNYHTEDEIRESVGSPMFYRFNKLIYFKNLTKSDIYKICIKIYEGLKKDLAKDDMEIITQYDENFNEVFLSMKNEINFSQDYNFRKLKNIIRKLIEEILINKFIEDNF